MEGVEIVPVIGIGSSEAAVSLEEIHKSSGLLFATGGVHSGVIELLPNEDFLSSGKSESEFSLSSSSSVIGNIESGGVPVIVVVWDEETVESLDEVLIFNPEDTIVGVVDVG